MSLDDGEYTIVAENGAKDIDGNQIQLEYEIKLTQEFPQTQDSSFSSTPALNPEKSFQYNLSGKGENPTMAVKLYNDGTDRSNGTLADMEKVAEGLGYNSFSDSRFTNDTVVDIQEQKVWLKEYINNHAIPVTWRLYGGEYTDKVNEGAGTPIVINRLEPRPNPNRPNEILLTIRFTLGRRLI